MIRDAIVGLIDLAVANSKAQVRDARYTLQRDGNLTPEESRSFLKALLRSLVALGYADSPRDVTWDVARDRIGSLGRARAVQLLDQVLPLLRQDPDVTRQELAWQREDLRRLRASDEGRAAKFRARLAERWPGGLPDDEVDRTAYLTFQLKAADAEKRIERIEGRLATLDEEIAGLGG